MTPRAFFPNMAGGAVTGAGDASNRGHGVERGLPVELRVEEDDLRRAQ